MDRKLGVYICNGCGIEASLETQKLAEIAIREYKVEKCNVQSCLCGNSGRSMINEDIVNGINTVIIAACSPRVKQEVFFYDESVVVERVNLREQVIWSHLPRNQDTQMLAEDELRMGITKASRVSPPEPYKIEVSKTVLVVGGGITGITASLETAKAGYDVCLIEKSANLGGWMTNWHKQYPTHPPYQGLEDIDISVNVDELRKNNRIKIFTESEIKEIKGSPGMFNVLLNQHDNLVPVTVGSIILANGFKPYEPENLGHLGYDKYPNVITNVKMEEMARSGSIRRPSDGNQITSAVFILCAGQRDKNHLPYCSSFCCLTSLKQVMYIREHNPEAKIYILYKDIRAPGLFEEFFKNVQNSGSVFLIKGEAKSVDVDPSNNVIVRIDDSLVNEEISIKADLVILATGIVPATLPESGIEVLTKPVCSETKETGIVADSGYFSKPVLNLKYRQGPELPTLKYGFPDSHFICFPYETRRSGIYAAGCVRQPMDSVSCIEDATGAALKAIQCIELTTNGYSLHPRTWDKSVPELFMQKCTQCKRCTEECPFGMYDEDDRFNPLPNPTRCRRCGICMGSCPERIISFKDYSVDIISSMVKAIKVPDVDEDKPRIVAFLCENDAYPALDMAGLEHLNYNPFIRVIPVRCLGSINIANVIDALSQGIDGILMIGCQHGEDYHCHYIKGSELADYRFEHIKEALQRLALEPERIQVVQFAISDYRKLPTIFDDFLKKLNQIGPNPYKGL